MKFVRDRKMKVCFE